jgi:hypothetical protein
MSSSSSKHDPVGSVIPTTRTQLLTVNDVIDALRLSRASVSSPNGANAKTLAGHREGGQVHIRPRSRSCTGYRVDPGYRNAAPLDELIMRAVAQRNSRKAEHD